MTNPRLQGISLRLSDADIRRIKAVSGRLGVRESDLLRFAIRTMLNQLSPLADPAVRGRELVPMLLEHGGEIVREFGLDTHALATLVNEGLVGDDLVSRADLSALMLLANGAATGPLKAEMQARFQAGTAAPTAPGSPSAPASSALEPSHGTATRM
jgi:hypothetical protein